MEKFTFDINELADINIEEAPTFDHLDIIEERFEQTYVPWKSKLTLRSHLDVIRSVQFHPRESVLLSTGDDGCIKLWDITDKKYYSF